MTSTGAPRTRSPTSTGVPLQRHRPTVQTARGRPAAPSRSSAAGPRRDPATGRSPRRRARTRPAGSGAAAPSHRPPDTSSRHRVRPRRWRIRSRRLEHPTQNHRVQLTFELREHSGVDLAHQLRREQCRQVIVAPRVGDVRGGVPVGGPQRSPRPELDQPLDHGLRRPEPRGLMQRREYRIPPDPNGIDAAMPLGEFEHHIPLAGPRRIRQPVARGDPLVAEGFPPMTPPPQDPHAGSVATGASLRRRARTRESRSRRAVGTTPPRHRR